MAIATQIVANRSGKGLAESNTIGMKFRLAAGVIAMGSDLPSTKPNVAKGKALFGS
ncbi:hypothetical protein [Albidovulum sp.]|uniref:hypothetical protein n=1 Tax=Albidovulum sp. TaxID=1872424 RepID=UPI0039B822A6